MRSGETYRDRSTQTEDCPTTMVDNPKPTSSEPGAKLGESLRALRRRRRWSLATVSELTGLAVSTLSRIENDQLSLTYDKLVQLCQGLGVDLTELLSNSSAQTNDAPMGRRDYTPPGQGRQIQANHYHYRYLCTDFKRKKMTPIIGTITAKNIDEIGGFLRHDGEETVYVMDGTLELHTEFYEPLRVETGGCVYFDSSMGHAFVAIDGPVTILSVCTIEEPRLAEAEARRGHEAPMKGRPKLAG